MEIPPSIINSYQALYDLCMKYPLKIPLTEAAKYMGMDKEGLRSSIEDGRCSFGLCVRKTPYSNRAFDIPTIAFYSWVTQGAIFKAMQNVR